MSFTLQPSDTDLSVWTLSSCEDEDDQEGMVNDADGEDLFLPMRNEKGGFITISSKTESFLENNGDLEICNSVLTEENGDASGKSKNKEAAKSHTLNASPSKRKRSVMPLLENNQRKSLKIRKTSSVEQIHEVNGNHLDDELSKIQSKPASHKIKQIEKYNGPKGLTNEGDTSKDNAIVTKGGAKEPKASASAEETHSSSENAIVGKTARCMGFLRSPKGLVKCSTCKTRFKLLQDFASHICSPIRLDRKSVNKSVDNQRKSFKTSEGEESPMAILVKTFEQTHALKEDPKTSLINNIGKNKEFHLRSGHRDVTPQYQKYVTAQYQKYLTAWNERNGLPNGSENGPQMQADVSPLKKKKDSTSSLEPITQKRSHSSSIPVTTIQKKARLATEEQVTETQESSNDGKFAVAYSSLWDAREKTLNEKHSDKDADKRRELVEATLWKEKQTGIREWLNDICPICSKTFSSGKYVVEHLKTVHRQKVLEDNSLRQLVFGEETMAKRNCPSCNSTFNGESELEEHIKAVHNDEDDKMTKRVSRSRFSKLLLNAERTKQKLEKQEVTSDLVEFEDGNTSESLKCKECNSGFEEISDLEKHTSEFHLQESPDDSSQSAKRWKQQKTHACAVCRQEFQQASILKKHLWLRHKLKKNVFTPTSDQEKEASDDPNSIATHMCFICKLSFSSLQDLIEHKKSKHAHLKSEPLKRIKKSELEASVDNDKKMSDEQKEPSTVCFKCSRFSKSVVMKKLGKKALDNQELASQVTDGICRICKEKIPSSSSKNNTIVHRCGKCDLKFEDVASFRKHCRSHKAADRRPSKRSFHLDSQSDSEDDPSFSLYECDPCDRSFTNKQKYETHVRKCRSSLDEMGHGISGKNVQIKRSSRLNHRAAGKDAFTETDKVKEAGEVNPSRRSMRISQHSTSTEEWKLQKDKEERRSTSGNSRGVLKAIEETSSVTDDSKDADKTNVGKGQSQRNVRKSVDAEKASDAEKLGFPCNVCGREFRSAAYRTMHRDTAHCVKDSNIVQEEKRASRDSSMPYDEHSTRIKKSVNRKEEELNDTPIPEAETKVTDGEPNRTTCNSCNKVFKSGIQLIAHKKGECISNRKSCANKWKGYCNSCDKTYASDYAWKKHLKRGCKGDVERNTDEKSKRSLASGSKEKLEVNESESGKNMNEQSNTCKVCEKSFASIFKLQRHMRETLCSEKSKRCSEASPQEISTEGRSRLFLCDICEDSFLSEEDLLKHRAFHNLNLKPSSWTTRKNRSEISSKDVENIRSLATPKSPARSRSSRRGQNEDAYSSSKAKSLPRSKLSDEEDVELNRDKKKSKMNLASGSKQNESKKSMSKQSKTCEVCKKRFTSIYNLKKHMNRTLCKNKVVSTEERSRLFCCDTSKDSFLSEEDLLEHRDFHKQSMKPSSATTGKNGREVSYKDSENIETPKSIARSRSSRREQNKGTNSSSEVKSPARSKLSEERETSNRNINQCTICDESFDKSWELRRHHQISHGSESLSGTMDREVPFPVASFSKSSSSSIGNMVNQVKSISNMLRRHSSGSTDTEQTVRKPSNLLDRSSTVPNPSNRSFTHSNRPSISNRSSTVGISFSFACESCSQSFSKQIDLKKHIIHSHTQESSDNEVPSGSKSVSSRRSRGYLNSTANSSQNDDVEMVASTRPNCENECHICGQQFSRASVLQQHLLDHHVENAFKMNLTVCGPSSQRSPVTSYSSPRLLPPCIICNAILCDRRNLMIHMLEQHSGMQSLAENFLGCDNQRRQRNDEEENMKLQEQCITTALALQAQFDDDTVESIKLVNVKLQSN